MNFLKEDYVLDFEYEKIYRKKDNFRPTIDDSIIMLNYLTYSSHNVGTRGKWVTLKEIPNGGVMFFPAFQNMTVKRIIDKFSNSIKDFEVVCSKLGGEAINFGDKAYKFHVLPKVNICVVMWEGDEDFLPNVSILFESSVQHLMHIETIIGAGMSVADKLVRCKF